MNTSISTTNLSVRAKNALHGAGIHTVEQLKATPFEQLKRIRNMGKKSLTEVEDFLQEDEDSQPLMASQATLRDYFAAKAMQAIISSMLSKDTRTSYDIGDQSHPTSVAYDAYTMADAMLKVRNNEQ